tara:strand:- start:28 stop:177 length:150 start_codon:yes stop_codon:yes gene_type:complete
MSSKIYFDIDHVKTWAIDDLKDFEGHKWILHESSDSGIWCMEWHEEADV